jgi:oligoribonuclease NrnB/cAMP/cGMP phosphodiesterase (DHH superfamily)
MILCYYHNDLDGICSAAIINNVHGGNVRCIPVQYDKDTWNPQDIIDSAEVFVVDFTFPDMEKLAELARDKLHWIDHHKTAMETHKELWNSDVFGYRNLIQSGCGLTWEYCHNEESPDSVNFIEDRDLWRFKLDNTKAFCMGISKIINDPYDHLWDSLLEGEYTEEIKIIELGDILLKSQNERVKKLFENGIDITFHGHKARLCNTTSDFSELGEYIYSKQEYDIAVMWQVINKRIIISLRSNIIDCALIAQRYSGGGHKGAAGFSIDNTYTFPIMLFHKSVPQNPDIFKGLTVKEVSEKQP